VEGCGLKISGSPLAVIIIISKANSGCGITLGSGSGPENQGPPPQIVGGGIVKLLCFMAVEHKSHIGLCNFISEENKLKSSSVQIIIALELNVYTFML
jgi:hypothetical protein